MPLNTEILRNGKTLKGIRWGDFHVAAMMISSSLDGPDQGCFKEDYTVDNPPHFQWGKVDAHPEWNNKGQESYPEVPMPLSPSDAFQMVTYPLIGMTPLNSGSFVLKNRHVFCDTSDGEIFELLPGDELRAYRSSK
jgi:hypothetical protein